MKKDQKDTGQASEVLVSGTAERIEKVISERPYEAVSLAKDLLSNYPNDYGILAMCVRTALRAEHESGKRVMTSDLNDAIQKASEERLFNPELSALAFASKLSVGDAIGEDDMVSVKRAFNMDPGITRKVIGLVKDKAESFGRAALGFLLY